MVSNPARFNRRYHLYKQFVRYMDRCGIKNLWTCELQLGDRPFAVPRSERVLQLRHWDMLWHKENALNLLVQRLPDDWETVAWIDADLEFLDPSWPEETLHQLQMYQIVQMFETACDLGPSGRVIATHNGFMAQYIKHGCNFPEGRHNNYAEYHPGFAWAMRREAWDMCGGLFEFAICGAGDRHMSLAWIGRGGSSFHPKTHSAYQQSILDYQAKCEPSIRRDVGFVRGTLFHHWHGKKVDRRYWDRWQILVRNNFNPYTDLKRNSYGVWQIHDDGSERMRKLRDELRLYAHIRNEDSIDDL